MSTTPRRVLTPLLALLVAGPGLAQEATKAELAGVVALYRDSLRRIATPDADAEPDRPSLVAALAEAEAAFVGGDWEGGLPVLARAELAVAKEIADRDLEALLPVVMLHHDLYLAHRAVPRPPLSFHEVEMARQLAELYARRGGTPGSEVVAARVLVSLAGHLQRSGSTLSLDLFHRAAELDPRNEAAWLGVAAYYEKRGGPYEAVVEPLRKLVAARPESREGVLRLGVNVLRLDRGEEGADLLARLFAAPENDWITSLAAQELARHYYREKRLADAIAVGEQAVARMPADQKLQLFLAYLYDRGRRTPASLRAAAKVVEAPPGEATRGRYNAFPQSALADDRRQLSEGAASRLPMLSRVVDGGGPGGGP